MRRPFLALALILLLPVTGWSGPKKGPEPLIVARGERIELTDYLVPGKTVVFDFTSPHCAPCRMYDEPLRGLHQRRDDIVVVKVDINRPEVKRIDWTSPVAQQYRMDSIPRFKIFGPDGKLLAEDIGDSKPARALVNEWCEALGY